MPFNIPLHQLSTPVVKRPDEVEGVLWSTKSALRDGSRPADPVDPEPPQGVIFSQSFSELPVTTANDGITPELLAAGWTHSYESDTHYTPADGYPNNHYLWEISDDPAHAITPGKKAFVSYRESRSLQAGGSYFTSDGILLAILPEDHNEIYVELVMKFQPGFTPGGQTKLFRAGHYDRSGLVFSFFEDGNTAPYYIWDYNSSAFGARHVHAFRQDPQDPNYFMDDPGIINTNRNPLQGSLDMNFDGDMRNLDGVGGNDNPVTMTDLTTGETLAPGPTTHAQIYGENVPIKFRWHLKMNSAPGVQDGVSRFWMERGNDPGPQLVFENLYMPWMGNNSPGNVGFNMIALGGNSNWNAYPNSEAVQEWFSMDDLLVLNYLSEELA